ncbi:MAG: hypothetical protein BGO34_02230 [Bacteroidia bacterium 44-10]|nr:MAG: hypothetical protein BGO34_02230 [Bacteroidia bacterium 44-10]
MKQPVIEDSLMKISNKGVVGMHFFSPLTILMVVRSGILRRTLPIAILKKKATINQDIKAICLYDNSIVSYVFWVLKALESSILENYQKDGTTVESIDFERFQDIVIPIPPVSEQKRIVSVIESTFALIDKIETEKQDLFQFVKTTKSKILDLAIKGKLVSQDPNDESASVLLERIKSEHPERKKKPSKTSDNSHYPFEIPDSWIWLRFSDFLTLLSGRDLSAKECNEKSNGIPYLIGASNIENNSITINRWTTSPKVISKKNDLLITCKGTVGDIIINNIGQVHIARQFMAVRTNDYIETQYLSYCLHFYIDVIKDLARGIIPGISREILLSLYIPIPPLKEQIIIIQEVNKVFASLQTILASIEA